MASLTGVFVRTKTIGEGQPRLRANGPATGKRVVGAVACLLAALAGAQPPSGILEDSIAEPIVKGSIVVKAVPFIQAPKTEDASKPTIAFGQEGTLLATNDARSRLQTMTPVPDGSGRLAFNDIRGVLYVADSDGANVSAYLDIRTATDDLAEHVFPNEVGLMGFAFHPDFGTRGAPGYGKLYTGYSATAESGKARYLETDAGSHKSVLKEWTTTDPTANRFEGTSRELLRIGQFNNAHNIGTLAFNPAARAGTQDYGALYFSMGDGGSAFDPRGNGQNLATPMAALLRINPLASGSEPYTIPSDNPFVGRADAAPEIWAYGLRHAQHFSFASDGRLFINDIGQNQIEEVNLGVAGANYGWNVREGTFVTGAGLEGGGMQYLYPLDDKNDGFTYPVAQYDHDDLSNAIGSGYLYEGSAIAALKGLYVFADLVQGRIFYSDLADLAPNEQAPIFELRVQIDGKEQPITDVLAYENTYAPIPRVDLRLGIDGQGELYMLTKGDGQIRKLVPAG